MLDIHCHILPGLDDGPRDTPEALEVARLAVQDGIRHVIATPHCHRHLHLLRADILPEVQFFNDALRAEEIDLTVWPGSEIQLFDIELYRREYDAGLYCHLGDDPAYTLMEFSWQEQGYVAGAADQIGWLLDRGTQAIIAHPERYPYFQTRPELLHALVEEGAWLQITVDSLLGNHGREARRAGWQFLREVPNSVLASDAHRPSRCSGLSAGYALVAEQLGMARCEDLRKRVEHLLERLQRPAR